MAVERMSRRGEPRIGRPRHTRVGLWPVVAVLSVLLAPLVVRASHPSPAVAAETGPTVVLDPVGPFVDGQEVNVEISGALDHGQVRAAQCVAASETCREETVADLPDTGSTVVSLWVVALMEASGGQVDCRVVPGCELEVVVEEFGPAGTSVHRLPLPFDPAAPLRPLPSVSVTPTTGLTLGEVVQVEAAGLDPWLDPVPVAQCRADDVGLDGCDLVHSIAATHSGTGDLSTDWGVGTLVQTAGGDVDCRTAPGACALVVGVRVPPDDTSRPVAVPLTFDPLAEAGYPTPQAVPPPIAPPVVTPPPPDPSLLAGRRYLDAVFDGVEAVRDVVIWEQAPAIEGSEALVGDISIDILMPAGDTAPARPVVLASPGEGFEALVARGYVVVTQDLRTIAAGSAEQIALAQQQGVVDRSAAVRWLRAHAAEYRLHPDAIVVAGASFRGAVALSMAWGRDDAGETYEWPFSWGDDPGPVTVPDLVDVGPVHPDQPDTVAAAVAHSATFPPELLDPGERPAILHNGVSDDIIAFEQAERTCDTALATGVTCEIWAYDTGHTIAGEDRQIADDRTALFLYEHVLEPAGLTNGSVAPPPPAIPTAARPTTATPGFTG